MVSNDIKAVFLLLELPTLEVGATLFWFNRDEFRVLIYLERSIIFITMISLVEWSYTNAHLNIVVSAELYWHVGRSCRSPDPWTSLKDTRSNTWAHRSQIVWGECRMEIWWPKWLWHRNCILTTSDITFRISVINFNLNLSMLFFVLDDWREALTLSLLAIIALGRTNSFLNLLSWLGALLSRERSSPFTVFQSWRF